MLSFILSTQEKSVNQKAIILTGNGLPSNMEISLYPTLLNTWQSYINEMGYEKQGEEILFVPNEEAMLNNINRVPTAKTEAQQRGIDFEDYVLNRKPCPSGPIERPVFEAQLIIPIKRGFANKLTGAKYAIGNDIVTIYGLIDFLGAGKIFDIKSIGRYDDVAKYADSHQLWYLANLAPYGFKQMSYVIECHNDLYCETYIYDFIDWQLLRDEVLGLIEFLKDNRHVIIDKRIFTDVSNEPRFNDCFGFDKRIRETPILRVSKET